MQVNKIYLHPDLISESINESIFDGDVYCLLIKAIESGDRDDLLAYAEKQVAHIKNYVTEKSRESRPPIQLLKKLNN